MMATKYQKYRIFSFLAVILGFVAGLQAQILSIAKVKPDSVQIGDPVTVEIIVTVPEGITIKGLDFSVYKNIENKAYPADTTTMEKYADLEILDFGTWKHMDITIPVAGAVLQVSKSKGNQIITNTIKIAIYNAGKFNITGPEVLTETKEEVILAESSVLNVYLPPSLLKQDTIAFNPIKDILREEADLSDYLIYVYILGILLIIGISGYYLYRKRTKKAKIQTPGEAIILPPHEKALGALKELEEKQLWQNGWIKEYQTGLTDIIRTYLEDRYGIPAPEMTTDQISAALAGIELTQGYLTSLRDILQIADLVKFAKVTPENDVHTRFMHLSVEFVENTKDQGDKNG